MSLSNIDLFALENAVVIQCENTPLKGPQLAYYLKKRNLELYQKAKEIKNRYNITCDDAFAILRGEKTAYTINDCYR
jgi:hypothetical protein